MSEEDSSHNHIRSNSVSQEIISYFNEKEKFYDGFSLENIEVVQDLGSGAFGKVQKVIDRVSNKEYAMKTLVISDDLSEEAILSEIELLEKLRNLSNKPKFLANYYGYCIRSRGPSKEFRQYNIILEFKPYSVAKLIETKHKSSIPFTENQIFNFFLTMIEGLSILQSYNIVHRDIKPQNIICTFSLGLVILNMGLPKFKAIGLINYNENVFEDLTQRQFINFKKIYIRNKFLCKSLEKMLRFKPVERITCQDLWIEYKILDKYNKWVKSTFQTVFGIKYFINFVLLWIIIINFYSGF